MAQKNWISVEVELPAWEDGIVEVMLDGKIDKAQYNDMAFWWRVKRNNGIHRVTLEDELITHWRFINN